LNECERTRAVRTGTESAARAMVKTRLGVGGGILRDEEYGELSQMHTLIFL